MKARVGTGCRAGFQRAGVLGTLQQVFGAMRRVLPNSRLEAAATGRQDACPTARRKRSRDVNFPKGSGRPRHIHFALKMKGREKWTTQCYVQGEPQNERDGIYREIQDPKARAAVTVDFAPVTGTRIGELAARESEAAGPWEQPICSRRIPPGPVGAASSASMPLLRSFDFLPLAIYKYAAPDGAGEGRARFEFSGWASGLCYQKANFQPGSTGRIRPMASATP